MSLIRKVLGMGTKIDDIPRRDSYIILTASSQYFVWRHGDHWFAQNQKHPNIQYVAVGFIDSSYRQKKKADHTFVEPLPPFDSPNILKNDHHISHYANHKSLLFLELDKYNQLLKLHGSNIASLTIDLINKSNKTSKIIKVYREVA